MGIEVRLSTQFRVLGPLEVAHDGAPVRLGGERQRALLALLVTHANALVTTERLIEHLFGGRSVPGGRQRGARRGVAAAPDPALR